MKQQEAKTGATSGHPVSPAAIQTPKSKGGRPLKFKSVKKLEEAITAYFASCYDYSRDMFGNRLVDKEAGNDEDGNPHYVMKKVKAFTVTGLALYLGTTRETLLDYEIGKYDEHDELTAEEAKANEQVEKFSDTIKQAKLRCYEDTEQYLYRSGTATGAIFSLKNNYGWQDTTKVETHDMTPPPPLSPRKAKAKEEV